MSNLGSSAEASSADQVASMSPHGSHRFSTDSKTSFKSSVLFTRAIEGDPKAVSALGLDGKDESLKNEILNSCSLANDYIFVEPLGQGSFGCVRRAVHVDKDQNTKQFAVKQFSKRQLLAKKFVRRVDRRIQKDTMLDFVKREIAIMKNLNHPNVMRLVEALDTGEDALYLILDYAPLGNLTSYDDSSNTFAKTRKFKKLDDGNEQIFTEKSMIPIAQQLVAGLSYLHSRGVIHRDIKPDNILAIPVEENQLPQNVNSIRVCLADLGSALLIESENDDWLSSSAGSPAYRAPECCTGNKYSGMKADIWALGCSLFIFLTGKHPNKDMDPRLPEMKLNELIKKGLGDYEEKLAGFSPELKDFLRCCLEIDATKRASTLELCEHPWIARESGMSDVKPMSAIINVTTEEMSKALSPIVKLNNLVNTSIKMKRILRRSVSKGLLEGRLDSNSGRLSRKLSEKLNLGPKKNEKGGDGA